MMEFLDAVDDLLKKILLPITNFLNRNPLGRILKWLSVKWMWTFMQILILFRILLAVFFRLLWGKWLKVFDIVPFEIREKKNYYEDSGVIEMHALLRGDDCYESYLEQEQKLPFPPADYNPYGKIYLARYFHSLRRNLSNMHTSLTNYGGVPYERISNFFLFQNFIEYITSHVAVNISD